MSMNELKKKLEDAFDLFDTMQTEMETLLTCAPQDFVVNMERWIGAYRRAAANLQFLLDNYVETVTPLSSMKEAENWQNRLDRSLKRQDNLSHLLEGVKHDLQLRLENLKSGRHAITGYHSGKGGDRPVFISREA